MTMTIATVVPVDGQDSEDNLQVRIGDFVLAGFTAYQSSMREAKELAEDFCGGVNEAISKALATRYRNVLVSEQALQAMRDHWQCPGNYQQEQREACTVLDLFHRDLSGELKRK